MSEAILPWRAINRTAPGMRLLSTSASIRWRTCWRRGDEKPTSSGRLAFGRDWQRAVKETQTLRSATEIRDAIRIWIRLTQDSRWEGLSGPIGRSEEHTSELQSRPHLVCRLLLEK